MKCRRCQTKAEVALPSHHTAFCRECFFVYFARQVERAIKDRRMFTRDDRVLIAVSGGKDSLALTLQLKELGFDVTALHIDLGIPESSIPARAVTEQFCAKFGVKLMVVETASHGLPIPLIKERLRRPICSVCGRVKRYYFNKTALDHGFNVLATGHNLNDEAARLFSNVLRWDGNYLSDQGPDLPAEDGFAAKVRPLYRLTEYETACYCFLKGIEYGFQPCPYSQGASFTYYKTLLDQLEETMPGTRFGFYEGFLERGRPVFARAAAEAGINMAPCTTCGYPTSGGVCGVCRLKELMAGEMSADTSADTSGDTSGDAFGDALPDDAPED